MLSAPQIAAAGSYEALFKCWRAVENEDLRFRSAPETFGKLQDGIYFARPGKGSLPGQILLFHAGGVSAYHVAFRRPPAHLVGKVDGKPVFHVTLRRDPKAANTIVIDYVAEAERGDRELEGKVFVIKPKTLGAGAAGPIRSRLAAQLDQMKNALEAERSWFAQEVKKQSAIWLGRKQGWQDTLIADMRHRLGPLLGVGACGELSGKLAEKAAPLVTDLRGIEKLIAELGKPIEAGPAAQQPMASTVPLFPGARLATEKETRCLGLDSYEGDYELMLSFATATAIDVADFYRKQLGVGPAKTERGYRLVLTTPNDHNPMGDHIDVFQEAPKNPCTPEAFTVRVAVLRKKGE
jgi:hypothetical protein